MLHDDNASCEVRYFNANGKVVFQQVWHGKAALDAIMLALQGIGERKGFVCDHAIAFSSAECWYNGDTTNPECELKKRWTLTVD